MKTIITLMLLLTSITTYAASFEGQGAETEYGIEVCHIETTQLSNNKIKLQVFALGTDFDVVISSKNNAAQAFKTLTNEEPRSEVTGKILFKNNRPVYVKAKNKMNMYGQNFTESGTCRF